MLLRGHAELVVEGVVPDLLHIIPVGDDTVLDGVLQSEDTTLGLRPSTDASFALALSVIPTIHRLGFCIHMHVEWLEMVGCQHEISSLSQNYTTEFPKAKERLVPF